MDEVGHSLQILGRWLDDNGYHSPGYAREVYLDCPDSVDDWVTELQVTIT
jgi:hypothetical protein